MIAVIYDFFMVLPVVLLSVLLWMIRSRLRLSLVTCVLTVASGPPTSILDGSNVQDVQL